MRYELIIHNGIPAWRYGDGTVLPVMAGGQTDEEALAALQGILSGGGEPTGGQTLQTLVGRPFYNPDTAFTGILRSRTDRRTGRPVFWLSGEGGRAESLRVGTRLIGEIGGIPNQTFTIGSLPTGDLTFQEITPGEVTGTSLPKWQAEALFGGGAVGATGSAPSYMSTQPAQAAQFAHDQEMARLQAELAEAAAARDYKRTRELQLLIQQRNQDFQDEQRAASEKFTAEQNRLAEEAMLKRERLGVLQNLVEGFLQSQQRASEFVLSMQPDPFRFAAAAQGMPVLGTTPQEGYAEALTEFAQRPAPSMDPNAPLSAIEGGIETIMGQRFPLQPGVFGGMSGGGTVPMGASGTFLVGEKGPEVMDVSPSGVTVRPLSGGFADGGGVDFDISSIMAGLSPLYARLGFENVPTIARRGSRGDIYFAPSASGFESGKSFLDALGIRPNLVRNPSTNAVYYVENGTLRHIRSAREMADMGFRWSDVINMRPQTMEEYGWEFGAPLTEAPEFAPRAAGPMGSMGFPIIEPTTGAVLPAPFKVAAERRRLLGANPQLYDIGTYAYNFPNSPIMPGALRTAEDIYTPRGTQRPLIGLR